MTPAEELRQAAAILRNDAGRNRDDTGGIVVRPSDPQGALWVSAMPDDAVQPLVAWLEHEAATNQPITGTLALAFARQINQS